MNRRALRVSAVLLLLLALVILGYGVLCLTFSEPQGGSVYVTLFGHRHSAHRAGWTSVAAACVIVAGTVWRLRRK